MGGYQPPESGNWHWNGREWVDMSRRRSLPWGWLVGGLVVALVLAGVAYVVANRGAAPTTTTSGLRDTPAATPKASPSATVRASPTPAPPAPLSTATIKSVAVAQNGGCAVGGSCDLEVTVSFPLTSASTLFTWTIQAVDTCTGVATDVAQDQVTADPGWNHVIGDRTVSLPPSRGPVKVVVITTAPDRAASPPLQVGGGTC